MKHARIIGQMCPGKTNIENPGFAKDAEAKAGECALLRAVNVTRAGTFMTWREGQDLMVPISQQQSPMKKGQSYVVYVLMDPDGKMIGSTKLHRYLSEDATPLKLREKVDLMIVGKTPLGYKAVINNTHLGLLFKEEVFTPFEPGDRTVGYIELHERSAQDVLADRIIEHLKAHDGVSDLTDYSPPEAIYKQFGVSKGKYKKALGRLYKKRLITVEKEKIALI